MLEHNEKALPPPEGTKVPTSIARAVMRGLDKERSKRFPTLSALMHELTPPPQRSPVRFIALAAIGALAVTGATAAVMTRNEPTLRQDGNDDVIVKHLYEQIRRLEQEREELKMILLQRETDLQELPALRDRLVEKDGKIQDLVTQVAELRAKQVTQAPVKLPNFVQNRQITDSLLQVQRDVEGCLDEWAERAHLEQPKGSGLPVARDADLVVRLGVTPDGLGHDATAKGTPESPSVFLCIEHAMTRIVYPKGPESLQLQIKLSWASGNLNMTGHVVGRSEARGGIDVDP
jgi:hypothetical protein